MMDYSQFNPLKKMGVINFTVFGTGSNDIMDTQSQPLQHSSPSPLPPKVQPENDGGNGDDDENEKDINTQSPTVHHENDDGDNGNDDNSDGGGNDDLKSQNHSPTQPPESENDSEFSPDDVIIKPSETVDNPTDDNDGNQTDDNDNNDGKPTDDNDNNNDTKIQPSDLSLIMPQFVSTVSQLNQVVTENSNIELKPFKYRTSCYNLPIQFSSDAIVDTPNAIRSNGLYFINPTTNKRVYVSESQRKNWKNGFISGQVVG